MIQLIQGDCIEVLATLPEGSIDLTVTSPPYDNLRMYGGSAGWGEGAWKEAINGIFRVTKQGGVLVWIVSDTIIDGSKTGTSFKQALWAKDCGFRLYDTIIWDKQNCSSIGSLYRYENVFEYMFVLSRGRPKATNIIKDKPNIRAGEIQSGSIRSATGEMRKTSGYGLREIAPFGRRSNVWKIFPAKAKSERLHPAPFSEALARDHIISWSNEGDTVLDPFMGSGTTGKMAKLLGRNFIGIEIEREYVEIAQKRIDESNCA